MKMRTFVTILMVGLGILAAASAVYEYSHQQRLIQERDELAAESLRTFRAHQQLQRVIPEFRPAAKPAAGQRDA